MLLHVGHSLTLCTLLSQAFSAFYFVMDFFKKMKEDSVSSPEKMTETLKSFCLKPWAEVSDQKPQL